jgi:SAM-dependent methyltransferase
MNAESMPVFADYARFYDALYVDKDYECECDFLEVIFERFAGGHVGSILDLGCGTGGHALPLAQRGLTVTGVDRSVTMLDEARRKAGEILQSGSTLKFVEADIRDLDLGKTYDSVVAMFAVVSYLTGNDDLLRMFRAVRRHLAPGGLFVFDAWHGPAVLSERPVDRYRIMGRRPERVIRFVHPELDWLHHTVDVHYKVLHLIGDRVQDEVDEVHSMRFLFPQEITCYLEWANFEVVALCPFLRLEDALTERDWNCTVIARASDE